MKILITFLSGFVFAVGLAVSKMTHPEKVLSFLKLSKSWDPSLLFVLISAVSVFAIGRITLQKFSQEKKDSQESFASSYKKIDARLVIGACIFGIGWGIAGLCPGPLLVNLSSKNTSIFSFLLSMTAGMYCARFVLFLADKKKA